MASLNISAISPDDAIIIEESDFDEIFEEINLPERVTVVSESTNVSMSQTTLVSRLHPSSVSLICFSGQRESTK